MSLDKGIANKILTIGCECNPPRGGIAQVLYNYQMFVYPTFKFVANSGDGGKIAKMWQLIKAVFDVVAMLRKDGGIQIVHIHTSSYTGFNRSKIFIKIAKAFGKKVVLHIHGGSFREFYQTSPASISKTLDACDCIIALSESWKAFFCKVTKTKVCIVDNIISQPQRVLGMKNDNRFHMLFLGLITAQKGIYDLVDVIREIRRDLRDKFCLHIGGNGETERLQGLINENDLSDLVSFEGWVSGEKKRELFSLADAYILPSYIEGLPISILEAMSYGLPILSTPVGGIPEVVDETNGILFTPGDKKEMADAIKSMVGNPQIGKSKGSASREKAVRYYPDNVASELIEIYNGILTAD